MAKLTLNRSTVVNVYELLGFPTAKTWNRDILTKKAVKIKDLDLTAVEIKDGELSAELDRIIEVLTKDPDSEIEVLNDIVKEEGGTAADPEPVKKRITPKAKPKEKVAKKYPKGFHKGRQTAGFHAGATLKKFGLENGITEEMVKAYDIAREKDKPREAKNALAWAAHVLNGYAADPAEAEPTPEPAAEPEGEVAHGDGLEEYDNSPEASEATA